MLIVDFCLKMNISFNINATTRKSYRGSQSLMLMTVMFTLVVSFWRPSVATTLFHIFKTYNVSNSQWFLLAQSRPWTLKSKSIFDLKENLSLVSKSKVFLKIHWVTFGWTNFQEKDICFYSPSMNADYGDDDDVDDEYLRVRSPRLPMLNSCPGKSPSTM